MAAEPVLELAVLHPLYVEVLMSVEQFGDTRVADMLKVNLREPVAAQVEAAVAIINAIIDSASGTFRMGLKLPNQDYTIPAGIMCEGHALQLVSK